MAENATQTTTGSTSNQALLLTGLSWWRLIPAVSSCVEAGVARSITCSHAGRRARAAPRPSTRTLSTCSPSLAVSIWCVPSVLHTLDAHRQGAGGVRRSERDAFWARTPSSAAPAPAARSAGGASAVPSDPATSPPRSSGRAGSSFPGEPMKWPTKVCAGRSNSSSGLSDLHRAAARHHHHLVGEGQRLDLVVRDVDQRQLQLAGESA